MRRILLATAALTAAAVTATHAQTPAAPSQGQLVAPYGAGPATNNNNNAWGIANTPSGSKDAGPLSTVYAPNTIAVPAPGTIVIRLNGRVEVDFAANYTSADKGLNANGTPNGYKLNPVGIASYMRLYPGFDGAAANGLRYGAAIELRENFYGGNTINSTNGPPTITSTGGVTSTIAPGGAASPSGNSSAETIYVRRAFTYLASDQVGILRLGQADGVLGLFDNCIFTTQCWDAGITGINGGALQATGPSGPTGIPFPWLNQSGAEYANNKAVYLSPQVYGFDFGVQYAPSQGNAFADSTGTTALTSATCGQASSNCITVTSGNDATRWYNQVGLGLRYQQTFGPVDFKTYGFYETAGKEDLTTSATGYLTPLQARTTGVAAPGGAPSTTAALRYDNLNFYKAGLAVTAYNVTLAADYIGGDVNGALAMKPRGGAPTNAVLTGVTYSSGPITLGAEIGLIDTQGDARLVGISQRHEYEIAAGGTYKLAPGLQLVGEYMYINRHQGGYDFNTGALGAGATAANNYVGLTRDSRAQGLMFATVLTW